MRLATLFLLVPGILHAQDFNDFGQLFIDRAADVVPAAEVNGQPAESLTLPGPVVVTRFGRAGQYQYVGDDFSGHGAVLCYALILKDLADIAHHCDSPVVTKAQRANLDASLDEVARFVAQNSYPPVPVETAMRSLVGESRYATKGNCEALRVNPDIAYLMEGLSSDQARLSLSKSLEVPRLPVTNPCL